MKRILLMVFRNIIFVPYWFCQLLWYAAHTDSIPEEKKLALLKKIVAHANAGGNVTVKAYGTEHIPRDGSFMFYPNHQGLYDVLAIIDTCPRLFSVVMKKELKDIFFLKQVFQIMGAYALDREDVRQSMKVIQQVSQDVAAGRNFLIFPEGTRVEKEGDVQAKGGVAVIGVVGLLGNVASLLVLLGGDSFGRNSSVRSRLTNQQMPRMATQRTARAETIKPLD